MRWASASAAMRFAALRPPQCVMSSWQISTARFSNMSLKASRFVTRSPLATGVVSAALIFASPSTASGQQGTSKK
jgi:hypothetical protein